MRCEVVAVGTELLLGQIVDTNSAWIGEHLALAGIDCHFQTTVGDNLDRIVDCMRHALGRSDAIIVCGGLGPTQDDITRQALAKVMGVSLVRRNEIADRIRAMFASRGREMPANNLRQADVPDGASVIAQMPGTAPGLICPVGEKVAYAVPGVPYEMREMVADTVIPDLQARVGVSATILSRVLRTWGRSESGLAELLEGRIRELDRAGNPTLAFQASGIEGIKVRITAKAGDQPAAEAVLAAEETRVRRILGDVVFGIDGETMESVVLDLLEERGLSLAVAESLTGGLLGARITAVPGADAVFRGALVSAESSVDLARLGVPDKPSSPEERAKSMAGGVCALFGTDVGLAATGGADRTERAERPPGTVILGLALGGRLSAATVRLPGDPTRMRQFAVISLLNYLRQRLLAPGSID